MKNTLVYKFGGTSLGNPSSILAVTKIIGATKDKTVIVVSAMGGTTDKLLSAAKDAAKGRLEAAQIASVEFKNRHMDAIKGLIKNPIRAEFLKNFILESTEEFKSICSSLLVLKEHTPRILDVTVARGERVMARIVAEALNEQGYKARFLDATDVICVKRELGNTLPDIEKCRQNTKELLLPLFDKYEHIIVPGFIASGMHSEVVTLGRGGSDYSATILADCVGAISVTLFKEVDGLLTADPRIVPHATVIPQLHYREAAELAYYGANVLHPRTIIPLLEKQIPLIIKNSFSPEFQGSVISSQVYSTTYPVKALTATKQQSLITIEGNAMLGVPGIAGRAFAALAQGGISVSLISQASSEANICFIVPFQESQQACDLLKEVFFYEIKHNQISAVSKQDHLAVVAVVGMGMKGAPGTASRTFTALAEKQINIITIAQGSSELNISFVIEEQHLENALLALHQEYQLDKLYPLPDRKGKKIEISIHGFGHIGTTLVQQMVQQREYLHKNYQIECGCISIADRSGILTAKSEFGDRILTEYAEKKQRGISLYAHRDDPESGSFDQSYQNSTFNLPLQRGIFVDLTAEDNAELIKEALNNNFHIVLANKKPLAIPQEDFDDLMELAKSKGLWIKYEATVGAGLPILDTISKLESSGDNIIGMAGCLSGTLGFIMTCLEDGIPLSQAVNDAYEAGYTEPDPREDLAGSDVARKALILSRALKRKINFEDIELEPLFFCQSSPKNPKDFIRSLQDYDEEYALKVGEAFKDGCVLRYVARLYDDKVRVGIESLPKNSSLGSLRGADNQLTIRTKRYDLNPLIVTGPGAGPAVTAAGVLNDIVAIAMAEKILK